MCMQIDESMKLLAIKTENENSNRTTILFHGNNIVTIDLQCACSLLYHAPKHTSTNYWELHALHSSMNKTDLDLVLYSLIDNNR